MGGRRKNIVKGVEIKLCYAEEVNVGYLAGTAGLDRHVYMKHTIIAASFLNTDSAL